MESETIARAERDRELGRNVEWIAREERWYEICFCLVSGWEWLGRDSRWQENAKPDDDRGEITSKWRQIRLGTWEIIKDDAMVCVNVSWLRCSIGFTFGSSAMVPGFKASHSAS